ncbi:U4/U6.U5 small nuclear ribonucleoprotein 27 kDa protein [Atheta coriaria]|uniref:U4/U6.U5 small nuclear ribonucleoprotein 27 kDa protein n=1 Tax=Dalotia coriaria TaxID=877792 RepID=UPI0031F45553
MGRRSRSRSPRRRERDRERDRDVRDRDRDRSRSREQRFRRKRSRDRTDRSDRDRRRHSRDDRRYSRSRSRSPAARSSHRVAERPEVSEVELQGKSPDEQEMMKMMGFCTFDTTKGKKVDGNDVGNVHVILKRKYRQYMNRKGGFNRPLDFVA